MATKTRTVDGHEIEFSNLDKVFFPDAGITKGDLIEYYRRIAESMLPHLAGRPLTLQRFPDGIEAEGFFQKDAPNYFPQWIERKTLEKSGGTVDYVICNDAATLLYLANQGCITPHTWLSKADKPTRPDRLVFDLDPSGASLDDLHFAARTVRDGLRELGLPCYAMTTGSQGFHIVTPLKPDWEFDRVRHFASDLAHWLSGKESERLTIESRKSKRGGRVLIDYMRNSYAQTAVAPYSVRPKPRAPVATPIAWEELARGVHPQKYDIQNIFRRLAQVSDPWRSMGGQSQTLEHSRRQLDTALKQKGAA